MATISQDALEALASRMEELESELSSYIEELAEITQERDALKAELLRMKATLEVA